MQIAVRKRVANDMIFCIFIGHLWSRKLCENTKVALLNVIYIHVRDRHYEVISVHFILNAGAALARGPGVRIRHPRPEQPRRFGQIRRFRRGYGLMGGRVKKEKFWTSSPKNLAPPLPEYSKQHAWWMLYVSLPDTPRANRYLGNVFGILRYLVAALIISAAGFSNARNAESVVTIFHARRPFWQKYICDDCVMAV